MYGKKQTLRTDGIKIRKVRCSMRLISCIIVFFFAFLFSFPNATVVNTLLPEAYASAPVEARKVVGEEPGTPASGTFFGGGGSTGSGDNGVGTPIKPAEGATPVGTSVQPQRTPSPPQPQRLQPEPAADQDFPTGRFPTGRLNRYTDNPRGFQPQINRLARYTNRYSSPAKPLVNPQFERIAQPLNENMNQLNPAFRQAALRPSLSTSARFNQDFARLVKVSLNQQANLKPAFKRLINTASLSQSLSPSFTRLANIEYSPAFNRLDKPAFSGNLKPAFAKLSLKPQFMPQPRAMALKINPNLARLAKLPNFALNINPALARLPVTNAAYQFKPAFSRMANLAALDSRQFNLSFQRLVHIPKQGFYVLRPNFRSMVKAAFRGPEFRGKPANLINYAKLQQPKWHRVLPPNLGGLYLSQSRNLQQWRISDQRLQALSKEAAIMHKAAGYIHPQTLIEIEQVKADVYQRADVTQRVLPPDLIQPFVGDVSENTAVHKGLKIEKPSLFEQFISYDYLSKPHLMPMNSLGGVQASMSVTSHKKLKTS